jgi:hypothetical protein
MAGHLVLPIAVERGALGRLDQRASPPLHPDEQVPNIFFVCILKVTKAKDQDPQPDPHPDPLVKRTDPGIRIRMVRKCHRSGTLLWCGAGSVSGSALRLGLILCYRQCSGSGIRCLLTPGSPISDPGSQTYIFESLVTIFWVKSFIIL